MQRNSKRFTLQYCGEWARMVKGECAHCHLPLEKSRTLLVMSSGDRPIHYKVLCCQKCALDLLSSAGQKDDGAPVVHRHGEERVYLCANHCGTKIIAEGDEELELSFYSKTVTVPAERDEEDKEPYVVNVLIIFCSQECQVAFLKGLEDVPPPRRREAPRRGNQPDPEGWTSVGRRKW